MMMTTPTRILSGVLACLTCLSASASARLLDEASPKWIWAETSASDQTVYMRKTIEVPAGLASAKLVATCDNEVELYLDGKLILRSGEWSTPTYKDITAAVVGTGRNRDKGGKHILAAKCKNSDGPAGLLIRLTLKPKSGETRTIGTDTTWMISGDESKGWLSTDFDDSAWAKAHVVATLGEGPWNVVNEQALAAAETRGAPVAPSPDTFKVAKGFEVERLYTVPKDEQGSWVNMTVDPRGRLIVSDQYGKLYRVTPAARGDDPASTLVEPIDVAIGEAQGLLWAFDSLYVVVNRGQRFESGLYRVTDTNADGDLDDVKMLRKLDGGGEHGPHAVVLSPDGKSLHIIAGNATALTDLAGSLVPRPWDEDQILPYMPDGNGFMRDERAPGGCVYRVDPDGKDWTLVSMGYRNPFDLAFNRYGDLFTYDSDMEWDVNTPWYRPTRVCQADSGSDLGYRNGSGKWPAYYPDSLPPVVNIGPGSPTGVTFGYGARFPEKYQEALFISDWSYGKLYAVHLKPEASHYSAEVEEFITGTPLPLTDVVINPTDHAMYFAIGGRRTLSGLYRVTYQGEESTDPASPADPQAEVRGLRRRLEAFHGHEDPDAVKTAWPHLGHPDRFVRYAARVAIEFQDPKTWQDKALAETETQASLTALLALARMGSKDLQEPLLRALGRVDWQALELSQKLAALRVLELAIIRMGTPSGEMTNKLVEHLNQLYPAKTRELNAELCKLMVRLEAPEAAAKTMALMAEAPTQEEQIEYATALRLLKTGWTPELRKQYFSWFLKAATFRGGSSLAGFMRGIKADAVANLSEAEKVALQPILDAKPESTTVAATGPARAFVKEWKVDDLAGTLESGLKGRDFDRGRSLFAATSCFACHRYDNEGGSVGPDLTGVAGRFSPRDLLESIILPSKSVSDQYAAVTIATTDGRVVTGRIVNLNGDSMMVNTDMLDPNRMVGVNRDQIEEMKPSTVSMMPEGLLNTLEQDEILDMVAYLLSRGDRKHPMFKE